MVIPLDVVTFGEAMLLLVADRPGAIEDAESFSKCTAGAETNVAIGLARLGLRVGWVSRLGTDWVGRFLLRAMQGEGIDCSHVVCDATARSGLMFKGRADDGADPVIDYHRVGSAASCLQPEQIDAAWLTGARHLHASGVFPALSASCLATAQRSLRLMREAGRTVSFDPNLRPMLWPSAAQMRGAINALALQADWVLPGIDEGRMLTGASTPEGIARYYRKRGVKLVVVKLGPEGAYHDAESGRGYVSGHSVTRVVDTVGAGDGFAVGVVSALLQGRSVQQAVQRGAWIGARAVQVLGDTEGLPTRNDLEAAGY